ncbi:MAG TPA: response regulator [Dehalococcoidia bacterium]|jgi:DNA-binding NarL/FixJ family response regulator|nr:response regulator [Dehalococcoidia bacterium]
MGNNRRILIVDDDLDFVQALQATLEDKSYSVVAASNRRQAEDMVRSQEPDMIILGTIMPRGDAFLFHQWLKQTLGFSNLPTMVINAPPEKQLTKGWRMEEGMQCDAEDFLAKPIELAALVPRIQKLLDKEAAKRIRVLIVDDHAVVRDGIRAVLALQRDMQVVGEAVDGKEALEKTIELMPDVVLMDIVMPVVNGLDATKEICRKCKRAKVLMLTQYDDEENVQASRQAGALGFIPKAAASSKLLTGIRSVARGDQSWIESLSSQPYR